MFRMYCIDSKLLEGKRLLVNGELCFFRKGKDKMNLFVVATVKNILNQDVFMDVIGVFSTLEKAEKVKKRVQDKKPIGGLNYTLLSDFDDVVIACHCECDEIIYNNGSGKIVKD